MLDVLIRVLALLIILLIRNITATFADIKYSDVSLNFKVTQIAVIDLPRHNVNMVMVCDISGNNAISNCQVPINKFQ
jgi:hypothetical protein